MVINLNPIRTDTGVLAGCGNSESVTMTTDNSAVGAATEDSSSDQSSSAVDNSDSAAVTADVDSSEASAESAAYTAQGSEINLSEYGSNSVVTISAAGEYTLTGTLSDGQIVVNGGDEDEFTLYLNNANITNSSGSAIYIENAAEVIITLVDGTVNSVTDGSTYANLDEDGEPDAAVFSHDDLTINGNGTLTVQANYSEGIESRDDLKILAAISPFPLLGSDCLAITQSRSKLP